MGFIAAVVIWVLASVGALLILVAGMAAACQERDEHSKPLPTTMIRRRTSEVGEV